MTAIKTPGQIAYEADCRARPAYDDGTPRRPWEQLCDIAKLSWERQPTPRQPAPAHADLVAALEDIASHKDAWRDAIVAQQALFGSDDDGSYWAHELRAFDRVMSALAKANGEQS